MINTGWGWSWSEAKKNVFTSASNLITNLTNPVVDDEKETKERKDLEEVGISSHLIEFVTEISNHPQTFIDFPIEEYGTLDEITKFKLSELQEKHARFILSKVTSLGDLRFKLCPSQMKDTTFWIIYFLLIKHQTDVLLEFSGDVRPQKKEKETQDPPPDPQEKLPSEDLYVSGRKLLGRFFSPSESPRKEDRNPEEEKVSQEEEPNSIVKLFESIDSRFKKTKDEEQISPKLVRKKKNSASLEDYYEKKFAKQMKQNSAIDEGIESDDDSYFSDWKTDFGSTFNSQDNKISSSDHERIPLDTLALF